MTRLYGALQRANKGKAQILPSEAGIDAGQELETSQPEFSVPWTMETQTAAASGPSSAHRTGLPILRSVPTTGGPPEVSEKLVVATTPDQEAGLAVATEQYRKLAAALHHAQAERGLKLIMVTSANPGEGKSLTASNLALTLCESYGRRVLLIDADLRRPSLHEVFGVPNASGLSDGLTRDSLQGPGVLEISPRLSILPSGQPTEDPTRALTSVRMKHVLDDARACYDWTIIDTPPIGLLSDAKLLSEMVDGVVFVVEAVKTPYPDLLRAIDTIGRERVLGAVLNRLPHGPADSRYYTNYYRRTPAAKV